jgi:hypothetical protein
VVGQEVDPGDDDPVEEVEQDALKGWDLLARRKYQPP